MLCPRICRRWRCASRFPAAPTPASGVSRKASAPAASTSLTMLQLAANGLGRLPREKRLSHSVGTGYFGVTLVPKVSLEQRWRQPCRNSVGAGRVKVTATPATMTSLRERCDSPQTNRSRPPPTREAPLEQCRRQPHRGHRGAGANDAVTRAMLRLAADKRVPAASRERSVSQRAPAPAMSKQRQRRLRRGRRRQRRTSDVTCRGLTRVLADGRLPREKRLSNNGAVPAASRSLQRRRRSL